MAGRNNSKGLFTRKDCTCIAILEAILVGAVPFLAVIIGMIAFNFLRQIASENMRAGRRRKHALVHALFSVTDGSPDQLRLNVWSGIRHVHELPTYPSTYLPT